MGGCDPHPNTPHHAPSPPVPHCGHPPSPPPPWELKGDLCLPLTLCFTVLEKGHKRDPNRVVFFKNFSIFSDVFPPQPRLPSPGCWPGGCQGSSPSPEGSSLLWSMESLSLPSVSEAVSEAEGSGQARAGVTMTARLCSSSCSCFSCVPSMCWIACPGHTPGCQDISDPLWGLRTPLKPPCCSPVYLNDGVQVLPGRGDRVDDRGWAHGDHGDMMGGRWRWNDHGGVVGGRWGSV